MVSIDEVRCDLCGKMVCRTEHSIFGGRNSAYGLELHASGDRRMDYDLCLGCYRKIITSLKKLGLKLKVKDGKTNL